MVHVEAAPGVVVVLAGWMLDAVACAGMDIGAPRADIAALTDLHRLLAERGFRRSSSGDPRIAEEEQNEQVAASGSDSAGANRVFQSHDDILDHCCFAWNKLIDSPGKSCPLEPEIGPIGRA